jgi:hypothetical protein
VLEVTTQPEGAELFVTWRVFDGFTAQSVFDELPFAREASFDALDVVAIDTEQVLLGAFVEARIDGTLTAYTSLEPQAILWAIGPVMQRAPIVAEAGNIDAYLPEELRGTPGVFRGVAARHHDTARTFVEYDLSDRDEDLPGVRAPVPEWLVVDGAEVRL